MLASLPHLSRLAPVDSRDPVEWGHPLNRGRVLWLLTLPQWYGGRQWFDLAGRNHGTLTNGPLWQPRAGGHGAVGFDGVNDYVGTSGGFFGSLANKVVTAAAWVNPAGSLTAYQSLFDGTASAGPDRMLSAFFGGNANQLYVAIARSSGTAITLSTPWVANQWQRLLVACDGTTASVYRNGVLAGAGVGAVGTGFVAVNASGWQIGGNPSGGGAPLAGGVDDVSVWSRALSPAEVAADYALSRQFYPGVLRRPTGVATFYASAAPVVVSAAGSASLAVLSVAVAAALAGGSGSAAVALPASAVGAAAAQGVGSATLAMLASAVGAASVAGVGSSALSFSASSVGASLASAAGSTALAFSASAAGSSAQRRRAGSVFRSAVFGKGPPRG